MNQIENSIEKSLEIENPERNPGDQSQESEDFVSFFETKNLEKSIQIRGSLGILSGVPEGTSYVAAVEVCCSFITFMSEWDLGLPCMLL